MTSFRRQGSLFMVVRSRDLSSSSLHGTCVHVRAAAPGLAITAAVSPVMNTLDCCQQRGVLRHSHISKKLICLYHVN